jgi:hypothetical protein
VAISVRLDSQRWVGPVLLTGRTVNVYDIDPEGPRLISPEAVVVEAESPNNVDPKQEDHPLARSPQRHASRRVTGGQ